jgi:hypothetical protein
MMAELIDLRERAATIKAAIGNRGGDLVKPADRVQVNWTGLNAQHVHLLIGNRSHGEVYDRWRRGHLHRMQPDRTGQFDDTWFKSLDG